MVLNQLINHGDCFTFTCEITAEETSDLSLHEFYFASLSKFGVYVTIANTKMQKEIYYYTYIGVFSRGEME
jgi:hypothetical protein